MAAPGIRTCSTLTGSGHTALRGVRGPGAPSGGTVLLRPPVDVPSRHTAWEAVRIPVWWCLEPMLPTTVETPERASGSDQGLEPSPGLFLLRLMLF